MKHIRRHRAAKAVFLGLLTAFYAAGVPIGIIIVATGFVAVLLLASMRVGS